MKNNKFMLTAFVLFATYQMSAQQGEGTGPMAKNRKPWKDPKPQSQIMFKDHDHTPVTGPLAKNRKPGVDSCETYPIVFRERRKLTGPLAKNARPEQENYWGPEMVTK